MPTEPEIRAWYNRHYAALGLDSMRPPEAYPLFLDLLDARPGTKLLDVSCGAGLLLKAAAERGITAHGVDLSDAAVRLARRISPTFRLAVGPGESLCFRDHTFDYVTCLGSLEHFGDLGQGLREMLRVAKPTARFCIMVPNAAFVGWKLLGRHGTSQQDINEQLLPLGAWESLFTRHGLEVERVLPDRWHAVKWRQLRRSAPLALLKGVLLEAAWRLIPLRWEYQFIFLLRRRSTPATGLQSHPS
ncbi:MAG: class I SAM-dependent methyltransferase [Gemmatimonadales bacterium]